MTEEMEEKQMNEIRAFNSDQFGEVRTVTIGDEPWFVAADVCRALEMSNPSVVLGRLDDDEKMTLSSAEGHSGQRGGAQMLNVVNEPGLYSLVLGSRKPEAKAFKHWITHDVIPAIRKTGSYAPTLSPAELLVAQANLLLEQDKRMKALESNFVDMKDDIVDMNDRVEQLESAVVNHPEDYVSVAGYARMKNIPLSLSVAQHLGRKAKKLSKARGVEIHQTGDERFGTVGIYRIDILDDVFAAFGV